MKTNKKTIALLPTLLLITILALIVAGCAAENTKNEDSSTTTGSESNGTVRIASPPTFASPFFSKEKGFVEAKFAEIGVKVEWLNFQTGAAATEALVGGHLDLSSSAPLPPITATAAGSDLKVVATNSRFDKGNAIIVQSGSSIGSIADLKGKKVGVAKGTMSYDLLVAALEKSGLNLSDVNIIHLLPDEGQAAFESGNVDAWAIWDPYVSSEVINQKAKIIVNGEELGLIIPNFTLTRGDFLKEHPDWVEVFMRASLEAIQWANDNKDEATQLFADKSKLSPEIAKMISDNNPLVYESVSEKDIAVQKQLSASLVKEKTIMADVDPSQYIDDSLIKKILNDNK